MKKLLIFILIIGWSVNCFAFPPTPPGDSVTSTTVDAAGATMETDNHPTGTATTNADPYTVSKTANTRFEIIAITNSQGAGTNLKMSETNAENGDVVVLIIVDANYAEMIDVAGQQYVGGYVRLDQYNTIKLVYNSTLSLWMRDNTEDVKTFRSLDVNQGAVNKASIITGYHLNVPQTKDYSSASDLDQTISTEVGAAYINAVWVDVTIDNDGTNEEIDLQAGTAAGQSACFRCVSGCDGVDDFFVVDIGDTVCTSCPAAKVIFDYVGDIVCFDWDNANSTFWYKPLWDATPP